MRDLELMDWKEIESGAENALRQAHKDIAIATLLLDKSVKMIKELGGQTNEEIRKESELDRKKQEERST